MINPSRDTSDGARTQIFQYLRFVKKPLRKFDSFALSLFPTEVEHVRNNNEISDPELISILDKLHILANFPERHTEFDPSIDARKYSRIITYFDTKLLKIDVDAYYAWIKEIDYQITTDAIPPEEQQRILREVQSFEPAWFHAASFYRTMQNYKRYLLIRYREKDYEIIKNFLDQYADYYTENESIERKIDDLTAKFVLPDLLNSESVKMEEIDWLLNTFYDRAISKKNRYQALVAYNLYHISTRQIAPMLAPMAALEKSLLQGDFYSRRILSNYYANKLLLRSHEGDLERAAFCGLQSIKQYTEDYLYYLNNYCSVLMNLNRFDEVLHRSREAMPFYKASQDSARRLIFTANYCRCLNNYLEYKKSIRLARRLIDELGNTIFQFKWHYIFRIYFSAMMQDDRHTDLLRMERKYKLTEREKRYGFAPYLQLYTLAAQFLEIKIAPTQFKAELENIRNAIKPEQKAEMYSLYTEVEKLN